MTSNIGQWTLTNEAGFEPPKGGTMMIIEKIAVLHRLGLHLQTAAELARLANGFKSRVVVSNGYRAVNAKSLLDLLTIGAMYGTLLEFSVEGEDAPQAIEAIRELVEGWQKGQGTPLKLN